MPYNPAARSHFQCEIKMRYQRTSLLANESHWSENGRIDFFSSTYGGYFCFKTGHGHSIRNAGLIVSLLYPAFCKQGSHQSRSIGKRGQFYPAGPPQVL